MSNNKLKGVGLELTRRDAVVLKDTPGFDFVLTSISSCNGWLLKDYLESHKDTQLITEIGFLDKCEAAIQGHLLQTGRKTIDLLLIPEVESLPESLSAMMRSGLLGSVGVRNPENIEVLDKLKASLGPGLRYIGLSLSPLSYSNTIVTWAEDNDVEIICLCPYGSWESKEYMTGSFTTQYLLSFAAARSSIVFLDGETISDSLDEREYLLSHIGKEVSPGLFELRKDIFKLPPKPKKAVGFSLVVGQDLIVPCKSQNSIYLRDDIVFGFPTSPVKYEKPVYKTEEELQKQEAPSISDIPSIIKLAERPEDMTCPEDFLSIILPTIQVYLYMINNNSDVVFSKLGSTTFLVSITSQENTKGGLFKRRNETSTKHYILYCPEEKDGEIIFQEVKNAPEEAQES